MTREGCSKRLVSGVADFGGAFLGLPPPLSICDTTITAMTVNSANTTAPATNQTQMGTDPFVVGLGTTLTKSLDGCAGGISILPLPLPLTACGDSTFLIPSLGVLPLPAPVLSLKLDTFIALSEPPSEGLVGAPMALATGSDFSPLRGIFPRLESELRFFSSNSPQWPFG